MAKRSKQGIDIHHPNMVRTVFVLTSLAILALLILIVKTTSFTSEPKAKAVKPAVVNSALLRNKNNIKSLSQLLSLSTVDCANKFGMTANDYIATTPFIAGPSDRIKIGQVWNFSNLFDVSWINCYVYDSKYVAYYDNYCSSSDVYDAAGTYLGHKDLKCKSSCLSASNSDPSNTYQTLMYVKNYGAQVASVNIQIPMPQNVIKSSCNVAVLGFGSWNVKTGNCCGRN